MQCFTVCLSLLASATLRAFDEPLVGHDHLNLVIACAPEACDLVKQYSLVRSFLQVSKLLKYVARALENLPGIRASSC